MDFPMEKGVVRGGLSTQGFESPYLQVAPLRSQRSDLAPRLRDQSILELAAPVPLKSGYLTNGRLCHPNSYGTE